MKKYEKLYKEQIKLHKKLYKEYLKNLDVGGTLKNIEIVTKNIQKNLKYLNKKNIAYIDAYVSILRALTNDLKLGFSKKGKRIDKKLMNLIGKESRKIYFKYKIFP